MRVNVYEGKRLVGWYDQAKATEFPEATDWDGHNWNSVNTGSLGDHETLYLTKSQRWVLLSWSDWEGKQPQARFMASDEARTWLLRNGRDTAVADHFGQIDEEVGPGRPEIGGRITVRLGDLHGQVGAWADRQGVTQAEAIRRLVTAGLAEIRQTGVPGRAGRDRPGCRAVTSGPSA